MTLTSRLQFTTFIQKHFNIHPNMKNKIKILTPGWVWDLTSSLPLELYPAWPRVLWLASSPSKRKWDWSSFNDRTRFGGLWPPFVTSSASKPDRPSCHRFSERKRVRDDHGRPGKRPLAGTVPPWPPTAAAVADPHPAAAIIASTTTHTPRAPGLAARTDKRWAAITRLSTAKRRGRSYRKNNSEKADCPVFLSFVRPKTCTMNLERVPNEEKLNLCRKYYLGGFALLPFLWLVNVIWFFKEAFLKPSFTEQMQIKTYVKRSALGVLLWAVVLCTWITVFQHFRAEWGEVGDYLSFTIPLGTP